MTGTAKGDYLYTLEAGPIDGDQQRRLHAMAWGETTHEQRCDILTTVLHGMCSTLDALPDHAVAELADSFAEIALLAAERILTPEQFARIDLVALRQGQCAEVASYGTGCC